MEPHNSFMSSHKDQIVLSSRQASMIMASMVIVALFIFITGYFLGKRTAIHEFSSNITQNALHDQIDYLLTTQSLQSSQDEDIQSIENEETTITKIEPSIEGESVKKLVTVAVEENRDELTISSVDQSLEKDRQYACLIGFGTKSAANSFVARLKKHHIPVILKTVVSKTASGKTRTWFQARTLTYDSAKELQDIVQKVKRLEHIRDHDIEIVHLKSDN